jgi:hypothetical protein
MLGRPLDTQIRMRARGAIAIAATAAALAGVASSAAPGAASTTLRVGVGETSIVVNGTTISTSNLTLAQLARFKGVPIVTLQAELDHVAVNTPAVRVVEALIAGLPLETTVASALNALSGATGGLITPQAALRQVVEGEGATGAAGANGSDGASGAPGSATRSGGVPVAGPQAKKRLSLHVGSRSLKGRPGSRVRVHFSVSSPAKLSYSGRKLASGSRNVRPGASVLSLKLPRRHGNYRLVLKAVSADGQSAQTSVALHDAARHGKGAHR